MNNYVKFKEDYFAHKKNDIVPVAAGYGELVVEVLGVANYHPAPPDKPEKPEPEPAVAKSKAKAEG